MFNGTSYYVVHDYGVVTAVSEYAELNMYGQYPTVRLIRDEHGEIVSEEHNDEWYDPVNDVLEDEVI